MASYFEVNMQMRRNRWAIVAKRTNNIFGRMRPGVVVNPLLASCPNHAILLRTVISDDIWDTWQGSAAVIARELKLTERYSIRTIPRDGEVHHYPRVSFLAEADMYENK
ncbi:hypothetical protein SMMN14_05262 [Sphaerulina musiva]